jgi:hypothetical protein
MHYPESILQRGGAIPFTEAALEKLEIRYKKAQHHAALKVNQRVTIK